MDYKTLNKFRSKLRILEDEISKQVKEDSTCCGITLSQCHILLELDKIKEASIIELARIMELDKSTLSRVVDGMVNIGLLNRIVNPDDRRFIKISLTDNGKKAAQTINTLCNNYYENLFKNIPEEKHQMIIESIEYLGNAMRTIRKTKNRNSACC